MKRKTARNAMSAALTALLTTLLVAVPTHAQTPLQPTTAWRIDGKFAKSDDARLNLSGAACAPERPPFRACIVVNDEKKYIQFFTIEGTTLKPGAVMRILGDDADGDPDAEGAAYADGRFYVVGSHGLSRKKGKFHRSSFLVFQFEIDGTTGQPRFPVTDATVDPAIKSSDRLRAALQATAPFGAFAEKPLKDNGLNIEGIAVRNGRLYVGLRGPSLGGKAFIMSVAAKDVFGGGPLDPKSHDLALDDDIGIRDLVRVGDGLLVLAGPVQENGRPYTVWHWSETTPLKRLAVLDLTSVPADAKAETLLLLDETPQSYRLLVMFDGIENGGPLEFNVKR